MTDPIDLTDEARRLTKALGGTWHGSCCPAHNDRSPSLSISPGRTTVLLHCFAGCEFTDIIRAVRSEGALRASQLPSDGSGRQVTVRDYAPLARKIWGEARSLNGTLGERYMLGRGLVGPWNELRYHPRTPFGAGTLATYRPALIGAVRDDSGLVAIHRIALDPRTAGKAIDLDNPKLTLGKPKSGAVRLSKAGRTLGIAEGIETAKSAARMLGIPVWAVLGNERFPLIDIPFDVTRLVLLADRGIAGERAATLGREAHDRPGRVIESPSPPDGFGDWNEADQARQGILTKFEGGRSAIALSEVRLGGPAVVSVEQRLICRASPRLEECPVSEDEARRTDIIGLTADIVAAHVSNNATSTDELPMLIKSVFEALTATTAPVAPKVAKVEPAVSIRSSVKPDYIVCLEDGAKLKMLKRYLRTRFDMTPEEYRQKWGLPADYPMVAPNYAETRRALARQIGLGRKTGSRKPAPVSSTQALKAARDRVSSPKEDAALEA